MSATEIWTYRGAAVRGRDLNGFNVEGVDGPIGRVERTASELGGGYLVVDAGTQAPLGGRVLLPAGVIDRVDDDAERVFVRLTRGEIQAAPAYDWRVPLEQHHRDAFAAYYGGEGATRRRPLAIATTPTTSRSTRRASGDQRQARSTSRGGRTKQELYDEAKRLGVAGRSKMSKAELARAVERKHESA